MISLGMNPVTLHFVMCNSVHASVYDPLVTFEVGRFRVLGLGM